MGTALFSIIALTTCVLVSCTHGRKLKEGELSPSRSECAITRRIIRSPEAGGPADTGFDDRLETPLQDFVAIDGVQSITLSYSSFVESLQVTYVLSNYSTYQAPKRGGSRSSEVTVTLAHREFVTKVEGFHNGTLVEQISFTTVIFGTNNKTTHNYGPFGTSGGTPFSTEGYVVGFYGQFSDHLTSIGMYALASLSRSEEFGGELNPNLTRFDDTPDSFYAPTSRINILYISHGDAVDSFRTIYSILGGDILQTYPHGGPGGNESSISFTKDEAIIGLEGSSEGKYIHHLSFITRRGNDGTVTKYGPFGKPASKTFSFYGNILGFSGSYANFLHTLSVYYT